MRWIVTVDHHGGCIGMGEDADGAPARGTPDQAETLPMDFRLHDARGDVLFEGRCGDIGVPENGPPKNALPVLRPARKNKK